MSQKFINEINRRNSATTARARVPGMSIEAIRPLVIELHKAGLPLSRAVLASRLGTKVTTGSFMQKIAAAKYYGFIRAEFGGKAILTELGKRLAKQDLTAAQEGFIYSVFGQIADGLAGRSIDTPTVALHLIDKANIPEPSAKQYAEVFIRAAKEVQLLSDNGFDVERLEQLQNDSPNAVDDTDANSSPAHSTLLEPWLTPPTSPMSKNEQAIEQPGIPLGGGFKLTHPVSLSLDIIADPRFVEGLKKIREVIAEAGEKTPSLTVHDLGH